MSIGRTRHHLQVALADKAMGDQVMIRDGVSQTLISAITGITTSVTNSVQTTRLNVQLLKIRTALQNVKTQDQG